MTVHAILGASSSKRWLTCPGSVRMTKGVPQGPSSHYAELGTAAHELAEMALENKAHPREFKGEIITTEEGNSFTVDDDMIQAVQVYYELIMEESRGHELHIERKFDLSWLHDGMFGTNDASFAEDFGTLYVYDYKHGAGHAVDAVENTQMLYYAIGAAYDVERGEWEDYENVCMTIVQPRAYHPDGEIRRWTVSMETLKEWAKKLKAGAIATEAKDAPLVPGPEQCRWCAASGHCPAIHAKSVEVARTEFDDSFSLPDVETLSLDKCADVAKYGKMIETFISACKKRIEDEMLRNRGTVEGFKVVRGKGAREWIDKTEVQRILSQSFPMEKIFKTELLTVAQMEKSIGKGVVADLWAKRDGALTVAPITDKRKEVSLDAASDFK